MIGRFVTLDAWSVQAQAFEGEATIICNRPQRDELHRKGAAYIEMFKGLGPSIAAEISGVELADPDVIYDGQAEIDLGGHRAVLRSWGPAHTAGDQTIVVDGLEHALKLPELACAPDKHLARASLHSGSIAQQTPWQEGRS
ncbi:MAG TPA: hypothetical protein VE979_18955 [Streptosporangiaceae bacterium]|nr:hypothetical protein [Streptosporangiaceae bacterium]